ncbi:MAG: cell wall hydrolase [Lachnospiraceae bacterium]|nr:cell wall hydrolase [Lachnospiraceae bacterium]
MLMRGTRRTAVWMVLVLLLGLTTVTVQATEETRQKINKAEQEKKDAEDKLDETEENLKNLNEQKDSLQGALSTLNTELTQVSNNLSDLEDKIADKEAQIETLNDKIEEVNKDLEEAIILKDTQYETMKQQIRFIYEKSDFLYMELFFSATSFSDFLNKNNYIEQLSAYQKKVLQDYKDAQAAIEAKQEELELALAQLEEDKEELGEYKVQVVAEQSRVSGLVSQTTNSLHATSGQISEAEAQALAYEQKIKEEEENLTALKAKLAEEIRMAELAAQSSWRDISEVSFAEGDRYLLANLIYCEAGGESYAGQVAVGSVVINRVLSSVYPDTVTGVIYQSGQFSPVASGRLALALADGRATASCYQAADEVMRGTTNVGNCVYFRTPVAGINPRYTIGGHIFY